MKKINYISIEIKSNGENNIFTLEHELMIETDKFMCIKFNEYLTLLTLESEEDSFYRKLEKVNIFYNEHKLLENKTIYCSYYSMKSPIEMLEIMKKELSNYIHMNCEKLFSKDIDSILSSLKINQ